MFPLSPSTKFRSSVSVLPLPHPPSRLRLYTLITVSRELLGFWEITAVVPLVVIRVVTLPFDEVLRHTFVFSTDEAVGA